MLSLSLGLSLTSGQGSSAGAAFDPASLFDSDTGAVYDLSDTSSVFQEISSPSSPSFNNGVLGTLLDLSGNDNHISAPANGNRPTYVNSGGVGYAVFTASISTQLLNTFTLAQTATIIASVRIISENTGVWFMDGGSQASTLLYVDTGPVLKIFSGSSIIGTAPAGSFTFDENFVATGRFSGATSRVAVNAEAYTTGNAGATDPGGVSFGSAFDGSGPFDMRLYRAILIGRDLTDQEIADARAWCAAPAGVSL
jgi:hypothetical protein